MDSKLVLIGIVNAQTTGGYGPFAITTKHFPYGQILDHNIAFGTVGLVDPTGDLTELVISLLGSNTVGATTNSL